MKHDRAITAMILALGIALSALILCIETILHSGPVSSEEATVLSTVLGASVGAVATYLGGGRLGGGRQSRSDDDGSNEPPTTSP
jgi:hypothetical protein